MSSALASTSRAMRVASAAAAPTGAPCRAAANQLLRRPRAAPMPMGWPSMTAGLRTSAMRSADANKPQAQHAGTSLSWDEYLKLRRSRRLAGMVTTIPTTVLAAAGSGSYFLTQELDLGSAGLGGIDPVYLSVAAVLAFTGAGWLMGPTLGSALWAAKHSARLPAIRQKDADFYEHIKRMRVDPSRQSVQNPVPDFYGEKIGSIKDYRRWLRDQAAFRRKAAHGLEDEL